MSDSPGPAALTPPRVRGRLAALGALALALATVWPGQGVGAERAATPRVARGPAPVRYRPVGCLERGGAVAYAHGPARKVVALSFDDGPSPLTLQFVRMLRAHGAVATFFMLGDQISGRYRPVVHEELRDGDALGDHSWSHPVLTSSNARGQLQRSKRAIKGLSGYEPCVFRPPYGAYSAGVIRAAKSLGLATVIWNVDPRDWALPGTGAIVARVLAQVQRGSIVLSHDGGGPRGQTLAAYPAIIKALKARGYRFKTIPQLLGFHTVYRRCRLQCEKAAISGPLPPGSIVEGAGAHAGHPISPRRPRVAGAGASLSRR